MLQNLGKTENFRNWLSLIKQLTSFWLVVGFSQFFIRLIMFSLYSTESLKDSQYLSYVDNSFLMGLRFDMGVANHLFAPLLLISFLLIFLRSKQIWQRFLSFSRYYLVLCIILTSFLSICNITFYHYFTDHFNLLVFGLWEDDTIALLKSLWENEPILIQVFGLVVLFYLQKKLFEWIVNKQSFMFDFRFVGRAVSYIVSFLVVGFGARGTLDLDMHPLNRMHTEVSPYHFLNQISYSPIYALGETLILGSKLRASNYDMIADLGYRGNIKKAFEDYLGRDLSEFDGDLYSLLTYNSGPKPAGWKPHVVVVAMESMGTFWLKFNSVDYPLLGSMQKHIDEDIFNTNFMPAGSGTFPSLTHWLLNIATLPGGISPAEKYVNKDYLTSALKPFKEAGYETHYMYGGGLGWRNLSGFLLQLGFDKLHGETSIKSALGNNIETHPWGVFDEDLFKYASLHLKNATKPQVLFLLSTTNHPPFTVPSEVRQREFKFPEKLKSRMTSNSKTIMQRLNAYRYSMDSLGDFLTEIKKQEQNIIVAATGDHSFYESVSFDPKNRLEQWGVPLYLYSSGKSLDSRLAEKFGSHANLFPSLYDLALDNIDYIALTPSLTREQSNIAASSTGFLEPSVQYHGSAAYFSGEQVKAKVDESFYIKKWKAYFAIAMKLIEDSPSKKTKP